MGRERLILAPWDYFRFWESINKTDSCWNWSGTIRKHEGKDQSIKYGNFQIKGVNYLAHRISYFIHIEETDLCILHECDNGLCVNPEHLKAGTRLENNVDCHSRNRNPTNSVLNDLDAKRIYDLKGIMTQKAIAEQFEVSAGTVQAIHDKRTWKHIHV